MSLSPVAIKEANHHIQGLVKRVHELEEQLKELSEALKKQNQAHAEDLKVLPLRMNQSLKQKDEEIQMLRQKLQSSESVNERLLQEASKNDALFHHFKNRSKVLHEISKHREAFESVLACLDVVEEPDYFTAPQTSNGFENGARETDLLDSWDESEDINGNHASRTSYSALEIGINSDTNEKRPFRDDNCQEEVFLPSDENPPPCFV